MKPVRLVIEGINSFSERQELDFEAVGRNNLFCICGKTGAGKTTIFDSIMFALYGSGNRGTLADMVNLSLTKARVEFEFTSGGDTYLVERTLKCRTERSEDEKKSKKDDKKPADGAKRTATSECMLYKNGAPTAKGGEANEMLSAVIGLDKDEFKNVYLLEQGEYADFLKKTPAKQTEAVGKIFSLMRYGDVHKRASEKFKEQKALVDSLDKRIEDVGEDSPLRLREVTKEHASLRAKNVALEKSIATAKAELDGLNETRDKYLSYIEKANALKRTAIALDEATAAHKAACAELEKFGVEEETDKADRAKLDELRTRQNKLIELNTWDKDYAAAVSAIDAKREACKQKEQALSECAARADEVNARVQKAHAEFDGKIGEFVSRASAMDNKSEAVGAVLTELTSPTRKLGSVSEGIRKLDGELGTYKSDCERLAEAQKRKREESAKIDLFAKKIEAYGGELAELEKLKTEAEKDVETAERALSAAQTGSLAAAVRAELKEGDVCPVCGGAFHGAHVDNDTDVEKRKAELEQVKKRVSEITEKIANVRRTSDLAKSDLERASDAAAAADKQISELTSRMESARVTNVHAELIGILDAARVLGDKFGEATAEKNKTEPELARLKAELDGAKSSLGETETKAQELKSRLGEMLGKTQAELDDIKQSISAVENVIKERETKRNALKGKCDSTKATVDAYTRQLEEMRRDLPVDMPTFDEQAYDDKKQRFDGLTKEFNERDKQIAVAEAQLAVLNDNCKKLKDLQAERSTVSKKCDHYKNIVELTKGKAMLNFVVAEYISEFTATASEILAELSGGKYTLGYDPDNGFMVTDYLSGGGKRKASTLSGGEMFLASLSVAIAIARAQSKGNNAFFFLDEGFGTLDDELIDTVFGALDILSRDCLVGVISHASALIERMPVCVEVGEATDTRGSTISY